MCCRGVLEVTILCCRGVLEVLFCVEVYRTIYPISQRCIYVLQKCTRGSILCCRGVLEVLSCIAEVYYRFYPVF
jgi:hypothetical protein